MNPRLLGLSQFPTAAPRPSPHDSQEDTSPGRMIKLEAAYQGTLERLVQDLTHQVSYVASAPPVFVPFHGGAYLQLNLSTELAQPAGASQYRVAALAFDEHISHLLRPVSRYFHEGPPFEGIDFSVTVH